MLVERVGFPLSEVPAIGEFERVRKLVCERRKV